MLIDYEVSNTNKKKAMVSVFDAKYYWKNYSLPFQREKCYIDEAGVSPGGISEQLS